MDFLKTDSIMEIKINVEIGLTPRLENALAALFSAPQAAQGAPLAQVVEAPQAAPTEPRGAEAAVAPQAAPTELTSSEPAVAVAAPVAAAAEPGAGPAEEPGAGPKGEPEAKPEAAAAAKPEAELAAPTDQELRTFMDVAISRFAGVDWQESKDERVIKIRRSCTRCFKGIAAHLGAEKPTGLVGREKRLQFIAELDRMLIEAGGTEVSWYPF